MAKVFPNSRFFGFDYHDASVDTARNSAEAGGASEHVSFDVASAKSFPHSDYDFITVFDCLHDMGDPVGAARHIRESLVHDGTFMIVEPFAGDRLEDNLNPIGRLFYTRAQEVGACLGAQAGKSTAERSGHESRLYEVSEGGANSVQPDTGSAALI